MVLSQIPFHLFYSFAIFVFYSFAIFVFFIFLICSSAMYRQPAV